MRWQTLSVDQAIIMLLRISLLSALLIAQSTDAIIVPRFPQGVWANKSCSAGVLRRLPTECHTSLDMFSTEEEKLACGLISQPNTAGKFPFGIYPTPVLLDTQLRKITASSLTKLFDDCALAKLIDNECFDFTIADYPPKYEILTSVTSEQKNTNNHHKVNVNVPTISIPISVLSVSVQVSVHKSYVASMDYNARSSKVSRRWSSDLGTLSLHENCMSSTFLQSNGILHQPYLDGWRAIENLSSVDALLASKEFQKIADGGFFVPTSFTFGNHYVMEVNTASKSRESSKVTDNSLNVVTSASLSIPTPFGNFGLGFTVSYASKLSDILKSHNLSSHHVFDESKYGNCRFNVIDETIWEDTLDSCTKEMGQHLEKIEPAANIPDSGFIHIFYFIQNSGISVNQYMLTALDQYYSYCECQTDTTFACFTGNGTLIDAKHSLKTCDSAYWRYSEPIPMHRTLELYDGSFQVTSNHVMAIYSADTLTRMFFEYDYSKHMSYLVINNGIQLIYRSIGFYIGSKLWFNGTNGELTFTFGESWYTNRYSRTIIPACTNIEDGPFGFFLDDDSNLKSFSMKTYAICSKLKN